MAASLCLATRASAGEICRAEYGKPVAQDPGALASAYALIASGDRAGLAALVDGGKVLFLNHGIELEVMERLPSGAIRVRPTRSTASVFVREEALRCEP